MGAVISKERFGTGKFPPFLGLSSGGMRGSTFLGGRFTALQPAPNANGVGTLRRDFYGTNSQQVFEQKFSLMQQLDDKLRKAPYNQDMADYAGFYDLAKAMMYQPDIEGVFKFSAGDQGRYGNSSFGNALIKARNAARARNGMVFTYVTHQGWDNHANLFDRAANPSNNNYKLTNEIDIAIYNLVQDLRASGDLNSTLIVVMSEFDGQGRAKRSPKGCLDGEDERIHWSPGGRRPPIPVARNLHLKELTARRWGIVEGDAIVTRH